MVHMKSRFLEELPEDSYEVENHISFDRLAPGGTSYDIPRRARRKATTARQRNAQMIRPPAAAGDLNGMLQAGVRVLHPRFGEGTIEAISGYGDGLICTVAFTDGQVKRIVARYANFEILGI
jgi:DNA helicase-2/ATP-dependent DNA helicase PcrA